MSRNLLDVIEEKGYELYTPECDMAIEDIVNEISLVNELKDAVKL